MHSPDHIEFLTLGYIVRDFVGPQTRPGGSALYSAICAHRFGLSAGIVTSCSQDFPDPKIVENIQVCRSSNTETTEFVHEYEAETNVRHSRCNTLASPIHVNCLQRWRKCPAVLLCPNWQEVSPDMIDCFDTEYLALAPQGWFRRTDKQGRFVFSSSQYSQLPRKIKLIVVSEQDIANDSNAWKWITTYADIAACTRGKLGMNLHTKGKEEFVRVPYVASEVDPTGAGDVFTATFLIGLTEGLDVKPAILQASIAASFVVEKNGLDGIPTRAMVEHRHQEVKKKYRAKI